jgi:ABC-type phosphate/phosphonate transport system substrate-binding protein
MRSRLVALVAVSASFVALAAPCFAGNDIKIMILREHGVGSAAQIQPHIDEFVAIVQKKLGWGTAKGSYFSDRKTAEAFIDSDKPQYGIMSLSSYLALNKSRNLDVLGQVSASRLGGHQYFIISKTAKDLPGCKGQTLSTDLGDDTKFIDKVVSGGDFKLADFTIDATKRPLEGIHKVIKDEMKCALIDDAQLTELGGISGGKDVKTVWTSATLPSMPMVALPSASATDKAALKATLASICQDDGKQACSAADIQSLKPASNDDYKLVRAAYDK